MGMNSDTAKKVKIGDSLVPDDFWNQTERQHKLSNPTKVLGVREATCQTGILLLVRCTSGMKRWLSAGWFLTPNVQVEAPAQVLSRRSPRTPG